ncbi:hypothetical protein acsn021_12750 [Anaerocolumna cellulosilytica]|uniref:Uncharacterized protein n=1 Tax=Anaerocolumna cellulosilytica TaxID=433286 RepID=A0A6S6QVK6_9FIRM|nr:hypothetical protein acsn021_12750 [Anaerocolumna cellulosilytica]
MYILSVKFVFATPKHLKILHHTIKAYNNDCIKTVNSYFGINNYAIYSFPIGNNRYRLYQDFLHMKKEWKKTYPILKNNTFYLKLLSVCFNAIARVLYALHTD